MTARRSILALVAAIALALPACTAAQPSAREEGAPPAAVAALPVREDAEPVAARVAPDVAPPTNRWYSGLVFGPDPQPVYPFPIAFAAADDAFTVDLPTVAATAQTIAAPFAGGLRVGMHADRFTAVRADPVSVTLRWARGDDPVGDVTIAEGSPVVGFTAVSDAALRPAARLREVGDGVWTASADGTRFGVVARDARWDGRTLTVPAGSSAQWFPLPDRADVGAWADALGAPVASVDIAADAADGAASTRLTYAGTDRTVLVPFPPHADAASDCTLGTFATAYGPADACRTTELEWHVPEVAPQAAFDLDAADAATRADITAAIAADLDATPDPPADTYHGGKALARLGALLTLARELDDEDLAARVADRLETDFAPWTDPDGCRERDSRCFVYDDELHTVVGLTPSFGSEEGNDHHFHYGYFLSAAAALGAARPGTVARLAPVLDALAADIAGPGGDALPRLRVFDPYRGHSWASGLSPFADGNNQESSSEAVAAWNGLALWADLRGDDELAATARWLLSAEVAAARALWLEPAPATLPDGFSHPIVSLTWGGKRDYGTWFSPEPSAILGIQILPLGPVALDYLGADPARVAVNVADAGPNAFTGPLGEYVRMYSALAGPDAHAAAVEAVAGMTPADLDDGTSIAMMRAWLAAIDP